MNWLEYALLYASIFYVYVFVYAPSLFLIAACLGSLWFSYQVWNSGKKLLSVFFVFLAIVFAVLAFVIYRQIINRWKNLRSNTVSKTKRPILSDGLFRFGGISRTRTICSVRSIVAARLWSRLAARFAPTNSGRLPSTLHTMETLPSFAPTVGVIGSSWLSQNQEKTDPWRICFSLVGLVGLEPMTPTMSTWCSNQLSYNPKRSAKGIIA